jgi:hypothetical protein
MELGGDTRCRFWTEMKMTYFPMFFLISQIYLDFVYRRALLRRFSDLSFSVFPFSVNIVTNSCRGELMPLFKWRSLKGIEAFVILPFGRRGNQFATIINALIVWRVFNVKNIVIERFGTFFRRSFVTKQGVGIFPLGEGHFSHVLSSFFWASSGFKHCPSRLMVEAAESIRDEVLPLFPQPNISKNTLVMSFRSGDIFRSGSLLGRANYGQPCCQFYLDAMERDRGHDSVLLVSEDLRNPCVQMCMNRGAVLHPHISWRNDLSVLIWAERLVLSRSTFLRPAMYLSPVAKTWYNFGGLDIMDCGCAPVWHLLQPLGPHWQIPKDYP